MKTRNTLNSLAKSQNVCLQALAFGALLRKMMTMADNSAERPTTLKRLTAVLSAQFEVSFVGSMFLSSKAMPHG